MGLRLLRDDSMGHQTASRAPTHIAPPLKSSIQFKHFQPRKPPAAPPAINTILRQRLQRGRRCDGWVGAGSDCDMCTVRSVCVHVTCDIGTWYGVTASHVTSHPLALEKPTTLTENRFQTYKRHRPCDHTSLRLWFLHRPAAHMQMARKQLIAREARSKR